ncbi:sulfatase atsG [Actinomadura sp. NBRC 104412]|uniref:sulfatase family protein n=1 Tax=Actinomadura sp. NBRC 104412 TaxID=3032203 RepID=UPI0024A4FEBA|nr:sulfatase [Actinomadura sp. NBRC 104412]GLZ07530.1 sulfatase atsG [Actinomadura sp. NBRC 104412]
MTGGMNILLITADDMSADTPGCFGGHPAATPAIDRLAGQGMRFEKAHVPIAVCQPSRSALITGLWPHRNGAEGFGPIRPGVPVLTDLLRDAGYRCGILGKVEHLQPVDRFGWELVRTRDELGAGRDPAAYASAAAGFMARGRPWFLMANAHDPHRPFHGSDQEREMFAEETRERIPAPSKTFGPDDVDVPGFLPDLPGVRLEIAEYHGSARRCDDVVDALLTVLDGSGERDRTLVVFLSDNGMAFPYAKANCYLQSTRTPLVVRWPGRARPSSVDARHFVSGLDLFPTVCEAAGVAPPGDIDGRSIVPLLEGGHEPGRDHIVTTFHETSAKERFEMRAIQTSRFGYIWNHWSDGVPRYRAENMSGRTWAAMLQNAEHDPAVLARTDFYLRRAPEEFYDLADDPHGLTNLIADASRDGDIAELRTRLADTLAGTDDPLYDTYRSDVMVERAP